MRFIVFRLALAIGALASGIALLMLSADPRRAERDPALRLLRIPVLPELAFTAFEALFLLLALAGIHPPRVLPILSDCAQATLGLAYIRFTYRSWEVNGLPTSGYIPFPFFVAATGLDLLIVMARLPFTAFLPQLVFASKGILGAVSLYAAACAVIARGRKRELYPSTIGGFWMALCMLAYAPFVGILDMFSLPLLPFSPDRSASLQLFPVRELFTLSLFALRMEPLNTLIFGTSAAREAVLSGRERQVAGCLARGMSNGEISRAMNLSPATVKTHLRNIRRKTGASRRAELVSCKGAAR